MYHRDCLRGRIDSVSNAIPEMKKIVKYVYTCEICLFENILMRLDGTLPNNLQLKYIIKYLYCIRLYDVSKHYAKKKTSCI